MSHWLGTPPASSRNQHLIVYSGGLLKRPFFSASLLRQHSIRRTKTVLSELWWSSFTSFPAIPGNFEQNYFITESTTSHFLRNEQLDKLAPSSILSSALQDVFEINFPRASFEGFWLRIGRFPADLESGSRSFLACRSRRSLPCRLSERWQEQTHLHFRAVLGRNWTWRNMLVRQT